jgi:dipeptidyl aminopeptidase B
VDEFKFPVYNPTDNSYEVVPYTKDVVMKYPKPGYANPVVSVSMFDLDLHLSSKSSSPLVLELTWEGRHVQEDSIIQEVVWIANETLILKEVNRNADIGSVVLFEFNGDDGDLVGRVVRHLGKNGEEGDEGWIDHVSGFLVHEK